MRKSLKGLISLALGLIILLSLLPGSALAAGIVAFGECGAEGDNLTWTLDSAGLLTISGNGTMADYGPEDSPWYKDREDITSAVLKSGVTGIGAYAFYSCRNLQCVTIPKSMKHIGDCAFLFCCGLMNENIQDNLKIINGVTYYYYCDSSSCMLIPINSVSANGDISREYRTLTDVYFQGTKADWANIGIGRENGNLTDAKFYYTTKTISDTAPELTGAAASAGQITVKWNAVSGATKYAVYRKPFGGSWERLANTITDTSYIDKSDGLKDGTTYYYTVRAYVNSAWGGCDPNGIGAKAVAARYPVLTGATASAGQINVKWNAFSGATKYAVYRKAAGASSWTRLTNTVTGTSYIDKGSDLKADTTYYYTVRAYLNSAWGRCDPDGIGVKAIAANYPTLVSATVSAGEITVKWEDVSGATKYAVYRKAAGESSWTRLANNVANASYTDKSGLKAGTTYYYTVRAYVNGAWNGYDAEGVSAKAVAANYPVLTSATPSAGQITVKWSAFSGATKYAVYRKAAGESSWTRLTNTVTGTSYTDKNVKSGTTYYYTVRAYAGGAWGSYDAKGVSAKAK